MTHYWWMHWFWITFTVKVVSTATLPQTLHPTFSTEPTVNFQLSSKNVSKNNPSSTTSVVIPISTSPSTNMTYKSTKKLKLLLSSPKNTSTKIHNASKEVRGKDFNSYKNISNKTYNSTKDPNIKDLLVINSNVTNKKMSEEVTTSLPESLKNETENITCLDEDLTWNQSLEVKNSERIGIEEKALISEGSVLSAAGITGITLGCVVFVGAISGATFFFYRYHRFNRPQVLNDRCSNPDSSGYIDDASVRDNSEEMYSLDNDSFLNSLEAMTIQNYWTDTVKHTKL